MMSQLGQKLVKEGIITSEELESALERQKTHGGRVGQNLIALGYLDEETLEKFFRRNPPIPMTIADTGLDAAQVADLLMKHILFMGEFMISELSERVKLSPHVVETAMESLRREKFIDVKGGTGYAAVTYTFKITEPGKNRAADLLDLCRYVGPAPVSLEEYRLMVETQTIKSTIISEEGVKKAFSHLVLNESVLKRLGPAISSGKSMFIYGPPGNGKTAIAETISRLLPDTIYIPYALTVGGEIITVFDPVNHIPVRSDDEDSVDKRWIQVKRPVVITGGELTMRMLDLDFNPISKYYEASLQMKANNGIFIADDFGRQQVEPQNFLNRWIVPLDRRVDFMTLHTGMKFSIPFDMLIIFSTNIEPKQLVDEAFLRRIPYKIKIDHPTEREYEAIFRMLCKLYDIEFNLETFNYLMNNFYRKDNIKLNACHPRDIIEQIIVSARYYRRPPALTREAILEAWTNYFVEM
jgi:energy-coupling factor transporter ATP-binding protein EcfA2/predicted transcriptional regulator